MSSLLNWPTIFILYQVQLIFYEVIECMIFKFYEYMIYVLFCLSIIGFSV